MYIEAIHEHFLSLMVYDKIITFIIIDLNNTRSFVEPNISMGNERESTYMYIYYT